MMAGRIVAGYAGGIRDRANANKYRAKRTEVDGITFDSKKEARRYGELKLLERSGHVREIELKPRYELVVNGVLIGRYTGDFRYLESKVGGWAVIVEDVKGYSRKARDYPLRKKLMKALYDIEIRET